jgi:predicted DNA-binding protein
MPEEKTAMKEMTIRLPEEFKPRLDALAEQEGVTPAEYARRKLIQAIQQEERILHRAAMEAMVMQGIKNGEVRDQALENASLEILSRRPS